MFGASVFEEQSWGVGVMQPDGLNSPGWLIIDTFIISPLQSIFEDPSHTVQSFGQILGLGLAVLVVVLIYTLPIALVLVLITRDPKDKSTLLGQLLRDRRLRRSCDAYNQEMERYMQEHYPSDPDDANGVLTRRHEPDESEIVNGRIVNKSNRNLK